MSVRHDVRAEVGSVRNGMAALAPMCLLLLTGQALATAEVTPAPLELSVVVTADTAADVEVTQAFATELLLDAGASPFPGDDTAYVPTSAQGGVRYALEDPDLGGAVDYAYEAPLDFRVGMRSTGDGPAATDVALAPPAPLPEAQDTDQVLDHAAEQVACASGAEAACPVVGALVDALQGLTPDVAFADPATSAPDSAADGADTRLAGTPLPASAPSFGSAEVAFAHAAALADAAASALPRAPTAPPGGLSTSSAGGALWDLRGPLPMAPLVLAGAGLALLLLGAGLYHRIARHHALGQDTRRRVYEAIQAHPGARVGTLTAMLDLSYKTVQRHVQHLQRSGLVEGLGEGQLRWFAHGTAANAHEKRAAIALASPVSQSVLQYLAAHPVAEVPDLCGALGLPRSSAGGAIRRMEAAGLLVKERRGKRLVVALAPALAATVPAPAAAALP